MNEWWRSVIFAAVAQKDDDIFTLSLSQMRSVLGSFVLLVIIIELYDWLIARRDGTNHTKIYPEKMAREEFDETSSVSEYLLPYTDEEE
ncbi:uncharacterized protein LY89DRAFT_730914 [Mollisia scopiformis]|uniref:Uncharacterized protein n=1 Tax=Mollisia scopiformis TaxID=149040 RepID=A0A194XIR7_MOLSC|nr:uncharacterized protein LY89DRAFT_730914 [Mollisia scopiformis]KUJ19657.1 hypothetical protein LY89DRAFT_730914 [Mollisia scopiformis]